METLIIYNPKTIFIDGAYRKTVSKEVFYRNNKEWVSLSQQEKSIVPANPVGYGESAIYLTELGALTHPYWIYAFNDEEYKLYPVWSIQEFPGIVDHEKYDFLPVSIIDGKLVELLEDAPAIYTPYSMNIAEWNLNAEIALQAMNSPKPDAAVQLLGLVMSINKKCLGAKWQDGCQWELLEILTAASHNSNKPIRHTKYGDSYITATQIADMNRLRICSGGWWIYDTDKSMFHFTISRA
ncbi:hypothetical protein NIES4071_104200 (plasmid) [Calothrix sp. NIES-4071]|nr:hypothetical protein NIES4071_104200 [Calothrix sp. NIES-4071]BAZ64407.1 hypothetical protein NIES4105_101400 [Calothrix sp. NIES-4105]